MDDAGFLQELKAPGRIRNVVLFISDSLRWDYTPRKVSSQGVLLKTVSSSVFTPPSFCSMITGLYPCHHGVYSFHERLPKGILSLFALKGYDTSLWTQNTWVKWPRGSSQLHRVLRQRVATSLEDIEPPFIYIEDEKGGHCPYGWSESDSYEEDDCVGFFRNYGKREIEELKNRYKMGIERSTREFERRLAVLERRDLLESTLVIFSSDHGELLGEYGGIVGHPCLTTPEIVYVPTILLHPDLPKKISLGNGLIRQVDFFPTIADILGLQMEGGLDGMSLLRSQDLPTVGFTFSREARHVGFLKVSLREKSVWSEEGGCLFREGRGILRLMHFVKRTLDPRGLSWAYLRGRLERNPAETFRYLPAMLGTFSKSCISYGSPSFSTAEAKQLIRQAEASCETFLERQRVKRRIRQLRRNGRI